MRLGPVDLSWIANNLDRIGELLLEHIFLTLVAVGIGLVISFALALAIRDRPRLYGPVIGATGMLYAIPSLALFALLTPVTGLGTVRNPSTMLRTRISSV
jgi:osmoprotectant transport system permease protein